MPMSRKGYKRPTTTKPVAPKSATYGINPTGKNSVNPIIRLASGGMAVAAPKPKAARPMRRRGR